MGELSAVQAIFRALRPGESREALAGKVKAGLDGDAMQVPSALQLALNRCAQGAE